MVELSDSTRRLVIFVAIVLGGSVLLIFDIPVLYLMMGVIGIAIVLLVITGTIILSELIQDLRYWLKSRPKKPKKEKQPKEKRKEKAKGEGLFSSLSGKIKMPSIALPAIKLPARSEKSRDEKKKAKEEKKGEKRRKSLKRLKKRQIKKERSKKRAWHLIVENQMILHLMPTFWKVWILMTVLTSMLNLTQ
jgi:hypothetical protein